MLTEINILYAVVFTPVRSHLNYVEKSERILFVSWVIFQCYNDPATMASSLSALSPDSYAFAGRSLFRQIFHILSTTSPSLIAKKPFVRLDHTTKELLNSVT